MQLASNQKYNKTECKVTRSGIRDQINAIYQIYQKKKKTSKIFINKIISHININFLNSLGLIHLPLKDQMTNKDLNFCCLPQQY